MFFVTLERQVITRVGSGGLLIFERGTLWKRVLERTTHAMQCGALHSIPTHGQVLSDCGIDFLVRNVSNLATKNGIKKEERKAELTLDQSNPFLPYDPDLYVADISDTHVAVLNKFNVVEHHLLIITRDFEDQETLLTISDFEAMWTCLVEYDGLAFYNGGQIAGASQRHKHLQMVPLPWANIGPKVPIEPLLLIDDCSARVCVSPNLPFVHVIAKVDCQCLDYPTNVAKSTYELYLTMLELIWDKNDAKLKQGRQSGPYNLLVTRSWMLLVPRVAEFFGSISINALGFAGALLVRNEQEMLLLKNKGPLAALKHVGDQA